VLLVVNKYLHFCCCYMKMSWGSCSVKMSSPYGDIHDEREGVAPEGLVQAAGGAAALRVTARQFQRLKQRYRAGGPALCGTVSTPT